MKYQLMDIAPDNRVNTYSVNGAIFDENNQSVYGVTLSMVTFSGDLIGYETVLDTDSNTFNVWTYRPDRVAIKFVKQGYVDSLIPFTNLMDNSNVILYKKKDFTIPALLVGSVLLFAMKKSREKIGSNDSDSTKTIFWIGGGIAGFLAFRSLLSKFGLAAGAGTIAVNNEQSNPYSPWKPDFYKNAPAGSLLLYNSQADKMAEAIHSSFGITSDDYEQVFGVFKQLRTKSQLSYLADRFSKMVWRSWFGITTSTNLDLLTFLTNGGGVLPWDGLSDAHLKQIIQYVNNLPNYNP